MKQKVSWPINLCKLEAGNAPTEIERRAHIWAAVIAKNTKIELVCNNRQKMFMQLRSCVANLVELIQ